LERPSNTQIDALGERIRSSTLVAGDESLIESFFDSFEPFAREVIDAVRPTVAASIKSSEVTEREIKSLPSIRDKLNRQPSIRLRQMQDIVGCRILCTDLASQDICVGAIKHLPFESTVRDRRATPTSGYRAMHLILKRGAFSYEVQVRTQLQHQWASLVESLVARWGPDVKYGGGPADVQRTLSLVSDKIYEFEEFAQTYGPVERTRALISEAIQGLESLGVR
jgi:ppGpp synthetase/RelA/SpoT-type nucleotidyltranferase